MALTVRAPNRRCFKVRRTEREIFRWSARIVPRHRPVGCWHSRMEPMSGQFAGSRSLDERRRRRLAAGSDEPASETDSVAPLRKSRSVKSAVSRRGPGHFPLRKIISSRLWKVLGIACGAGLVAAGILVGGWAAKTRSAQLGPGFQHVFDLQQAMLVRSYTAGAFW